jgi:NhaA family Na+:H+ antiporter
VVFVTALAIFDDLGGIAVIAIFYGGGLDARWFAVAVAVIVALVSAGRHGTQSLVVYAVLGVVLWYALHRAGIHPAIAGVGTGLAVSAPRPLQRFEHALHPWVAFGIMPLFALVNAGVPLRLSSALAPVSLGCALGLFAGKQLGIFAFTSLATRFGVAPMPGTARTLYGVSVIAGIGFTVALFIAGLAFPASPELLDEAKLGIVAGSVLSALAGFVWLRLATPRSVLS